MYLSLSVGNRSIVVLVCIVNYLYLITKSCYKCLNFHIFSVT